MGINNAIRIAYEPIREVAAGDISDVYSVFGTPFAHAMRLIRIVNNTDADLFISYDGTTDHDIIPASGFALYDYGSNKANNAGNLEQAMNTQPWVRLVSADATTGSVYLITVYAAGTPD